MDSAVARGADLLFMGLEVFGEAVPASSKSADCDIAALLGCVMEVSFYIGRAVVR